MRRLALIPVLCTAAWAQTPSLPPIVPIEAVLRNPGAYDGKAIRVEGRVSEFRQKTSRAGRPYVTLKLGDKPMQVSVYGQGSLNPAPKDGQSAEVYGTFAAARTVGKFTYRNEIDFTRDPKKRATSVFGVKVRKEG